MADPLNRASSQAVTVATGSRLHFGMFSFGQPGVRAFGGVGAMIDAPGVRLRVQHADRLQACGPMAERALAAARLVGKSWGHGGELACRIEILDAPRHHIGLGAGTQLALAVGKALHELYQRPLESAAQLARAAGRGVRSAVGLHGFWHGGLILEGGKYAGDEISPLLARLELPDRWRFVLACPRDARGISGAEEQSAFEALPPVPESLTAELCREALLHLLPAAATGDFAEFSRSLYRFGQLAGRCFATQQAGIYATPRTAELVREIRALDIEGVSQSSWGPTVFAVVQDQAAADWLAEDLMRRFERDVETWIARPLNVGARTETSDATLSL